MVNSKSRHYITAMMKRGRGRKMKQMSESRENHTNVLLNPTKKVHGKPFNFI